MDTAPIQTEIAEQPKLYQMTYSSMLKIPLYFPGTSVPHVYKLSLFVHQCYLALYGLV